MLHVFYLNDGTEITVDAAAESVVVDRQGRVDGIGDWLKVGVSASLAAGGLAGPQVDEFVGVRADWATPNGVFAAVWDTARSCDLFVVSATSLG